MEVQIGSSENDKVVIEDAYDFALRVMECFANNMAQTIYKWSDEGFRESVNNAIEYARTETMRDPTFWERVMFLPNELRLNLGFRYLDDETREQGKMLMPFWIYACLPMDFEAGGEKKRDVGDDTRFGCVFWLV